MKMSDEEKPRSIRFPESLWRAIDVEAKKCKRSAVKQMEAVLTAYYGLDNVELDASSLERARGQNQQPIIDKSGKFAKFPMPEGMIDDPPEGIELKSQAIPILRESAGENDRKHQ